MSHNVKYKLNTQTTDFQVSHGCISLVSRIVHLIKKLWLKIKVVVALFAISNPFYQTELSDCYCCCFCIYKCSINVPHNRFFVLLGVIVLNIFSC